ncbi:diacylglycerol kinase [Rhodopirellula sp. JC740]|uniref:Diacylglycerol kinase n=1 Tax=Rhodopirellula halodulae TaxID=2894198 RepID=A0ABS8NCJ4_9BACT|nr:MULTISPECIES: diacylglycerol kinase [unclassified Rhodopirellula]MCC9641268.1 diacylglycerol kinase [Rhodopirellula sp. JC740]MCC9657676.1 diacylglycerol kinase [Rhodopirellula sp. JC737]
MPSKPGTWLFKFQCAWRGIWFAVGDQNSFWVHLPIACCVVGLAGWLRLGPLQWATLLLAIGMVLTAELLNTSLELIVSVVHPQRHPRIGQALDIAAGAVLVMSLAAAAVGCIVLMPPLCDRLFGG